MNEESFQKLMKAIVTIADGFEDLGAKADLLKTLIGEIVEVGEVEHLTKGSQLLARLIKAEKKLTILPVESLQIKADDPALQKFLYPRILDKLKEKQDVNYTIEKQGEFLRAISLEGPLTAKIIEELKNPLLWSFDKATSRIQNQK